MTRVQGRKDKENPKFENRAQSPEGDKLIIWLEIQRSMKSEEIRTPEALSLYGLYILKDYQTSLRFLKQQSDEQNQM